MVGAVACVACRQSRFYSGWRWDSDIFEFWKGTTTRSVGRILLHHIRSHFLYKQYYNIDHLAHLAISLNIEFNVFHHGERSEMHISLEISGASSKGKMYVSHHNAKHIMMMFFEQ
jgi:hypothetical protein